MGMVVDSYRFAAAAPSFDPETDITWHSLFWAEGTAFTALGLSDTDAVSTWPNETAETDATQGTALRQPSYVASNASLNSQPSVRFAQTDDFMQAASFTSNPTTPFSVVAVVNITDVGTSRTMFDGVSGDSARVFVTNSDASLGGGFNFTAGSWTPVTGSVLWVGRVLTGTDEAEINGTSVMSSSVFDPTLTGFCLNGRRTGTTNAWGVEMAFVGIYSGDVTADGSWADFEAWVTSHYGITIA